MKCYEYRALVATPANLTELNYFGDNGWELVAVSEGILYLKRELVK